MKFGRRPRKFDPRIPQLSMLRHQAPHLLPPAIDYARVLPASLGMYGNDFLGDCVEAATYHAVQTWSANANPPILSAPEADAVLLYEQAAGYNPDDPSTDQGSVIQDVLAYWLNPGIPFVGPTARQPLAAYVEIDQRTLDNVRQSIYDAGVVFIGFDVPASFDFSPVWTYDPSADNSIVGGHCVVLTGYNDASRLFTVVSWGQKYQMTYGFFEQFVDEAYMLADAEWVQRTGRTPLGMSLTDLEALMGSLKWGGGSRDRHHWHKNKRHHRRKKKAFATAAS